MNSLMEVDRCQDIKLNLTGTHNKALFLTAISLRSIVAGELCRWLYSNDKKCKYIGLEPRTARFEVQILVNYLLFPPSHFLLYYPCSLPTEHGSGS
jgi:hypothetical protein